LDETAHIGEAAPAAPLEDGPGDADRPSVPPGPSDASPAEPPVAEGAPPAALPSADLAIAPAEAVPELVLVLVLAVEPPPAEPVAAAPDAPVETRAESIAAAMELPAAPVAPADLTGVVEAAQAASPTAEEPELEPREQAAPASEVPPAQPVSETAKPPPDARLLAPPPAPGASAPERGPSEAAAKADAPEEDPGRTETPPAAAWDAPPPLLPPLAAEVAKPGLGGPENDDESLPSAPGPAPVASEPPGVHDRPAASVAPETLLTELEAVHNAAQPPPADTVLAATEIPADAGPAPRLETPGSIGTGAPAALVQTAPLDASVPAAAWTRPAAATPPPEPPSVRHLPVWLPRSRPSETTPHALPDLRSPLRYLRLALRATALGAAGLVVTVLALVLLYRWVNPPVSALMVGRSLAGTAIERSWMPLERISPHLMRAVILSEDGGFCRHGGVDWAAIEEAIESDRGGSTITMQVVKNLFLWPSRSYVRKAIEIGLAYLVEAVWSKRRILEIYLNVAEWGDGVFGAEEAAQTHFGKRAARLTAEEAALLAAALPNPIERTAGAPSLMTGRLASRLLVRMRNSRADLSCVPVPRMAAPRPGPQKLPQRSPQRTPEKAPLVQGPRMTL